jgi:hypothetical protein
MTPNSSADALLTPSGQGEWNKMDDITSHTRLANGKTRETVDGEELVTQDTQGSLNPAGDENATGESVRYRVYRIRWFGLLQLVLLNIVISWDVSLNPHDRIFSFDSWDFLPGQNRWGTGADLSFWECQWISFSPLSKSSAEYFHVTESTINWLSTAFLFAFCVMSP